MSHLELSWKCVTTDLLVLNSAASLMWQEERWKMSLYVEFLVCVKSLLLCCRLNFAPEKLRLTRE